MYPFVPYREEAGSRREGAESISVPDLQHDIRSNAIIAIRYPGLALCSDSSSVLLQ
jgi:hypothetical protein